MDITEYQLRDAVSILGFPFEGEPPTVDAVKKVHRNLIRQWHPDVCKKPNALEMSKKINSAAELVLAFIPAYHKEMELRRRQVSPLWSGMVISFSVTVDDSGTTTGTTFNF